MPVRVARFPKLQNWRIQTPRQLWEVMCAQLIVPINRVENVNFFTNLLAVISTLAKYCPRVCNYCLSGCRGGEGCD